MLITVLAAPEGRYVATAQEGDAAWDVYVAWESSKLIRKRTRWWHTAASWDASLAEAMQRAWHGRRLHVDLLDYDTPDEEPMSLSLGESCMLTVRVPLLLRRFIPSKVSTPSLCCPAVLRRPLKPVCPCWPRYAVYLIQLSLMLTASIDAAHTRQAAMEQALQAAQASLDAERVKYREVRLRTNAAPGRRSRCTSVVFVILAHTSWPPSVRTRDSCRRHTDLGGFEGD